MRKALTFLVLIFLLSGLALAEKAPLNVAIIWHQHQPLYLNTITEEYELPWVRVHGVQEYVDSPRVMAKFPGINVTYNLQPSLLWQIMDYVEITPQEQAKGGLYQYIGAVDDHLQWIWKLITDPASLSADEIEDARAVLLDQRGNTSSSDRRTTTERMTCRRDREGAC